MAANMDTTGTFEIAKCFAEHGMFVCIHKHYSIDEWKTFAKNNKVDFCHSWSKFRGKCFLGSNQFWYPYPMWNFSANCLGQISIVFDDEGHVTEKPRPPLNSLGTKYPIKTLELIPWELLKTHYPHGIHSSHSYYSIFTTKFREFWIILQWVLEHLMPTLRKFNKFLMLSRIFILFAWMWQMAIQSILLITSEKFDLDSHNTQSLLEMSSQECFFYFYG